MSVVTLRVFAAHPVARAQYIRLIKAEKDFRLTTGQENFEVGLFDGALPSLEASLNLLRLKFPSMRPLLLSDLCDEDECVRWILRGFWGLVPYEHYEAELPRAVRQLADGQLWFPAAVVTRWMKIDDPATALRDRSSLTMREREVMELLQRRLSNKEIANLLRVSERTVKFHVGNILHKLSLDSRQEISLRWAPDPGMA